MLACRWPGGQPGGVLTSHRARVISVSVGLSLLAALAFAVSAMMQQRAARTAAAGATGGGWLPILGLLRRLLRDPAWLAGWGLNVVGFLLHAVALHVGSLAVVQAVLVTQLLIALGLSNVVFRHRPSVTDWFATASVCAGVVLLIELRGGVAQTIPGRGAVGATLAVSVTAVAVMVLLARSVGARRQLRAALIAVGAGTCFTTTAVLVVVVASDLSRVGVVGLVDWPPIALAGSAVLGSLLVQDSFAAGSLPTSLTTMTVTDPVLSCVAAVALFDAVGIGGPVPAAGLLLAGVLTTIGAALIANSPTLHRHPQPAPSGADERAVRRGPDPGGEDRLDRAQRDVAQPALREIVGMQRDPDETTVRPPRLPLG
jgi:hypothetical protein